MLYWAWDTNLYMYNMKENHNNNSSIQYVCHAYKESLVGDVYQHTEQLSLITSLLCIKKFIRGQANDFDSVCAHQSDVCHAYQVLKKGGLKDENIIVFMYDDIATDEENPRPGVIINSPKGQDVYKGVPKVHFSSSF